ncbi:CdaR family protein [Paenibacillus sp. FA6]|uniref:CdaR family protein n=1 Tax=Paenibacillus sp. FA6 TaxID=3413029 RepID=UPI003F660BF9
MDRWIKNNTMVKILAVAVSILLWGMVHNDDVTPTPTSSIDTTIIENVKVQPFGLDDSLYVLNSLNIDRVRIEVKGKRSAITSIFNDDYKVTLDLSEIIEGTFTVPLSYELPSGVDLVSMSPSKVTVTIEKKVKESFPVTVVTTGTLFEGYTLGEILIEPNTVQVTLPDSELEKVTKVQGTVKLDGDKDTISLKRMKLIALDGNGQEVKGAVIEPAEVAIQIPIIAPSKIVPLNIQYTGSLPEGLVLSKTQPNVGEVTIYGPKDVLSQIESFDTASVDLSTIDKEGKSTISVNLVPPAGVERIEPNVVQVDVEIEVDVESVDQITIDNIPIEIEDASVDTQVTIVKPEGKSLSLTLTGANTLLNNLQASDIKVVASAKQLKSGIHEVPLIVSLPESISLVKNNTLMATVEVKDKISTPTMNDTDKPGIDLNEKDDIKDPSNGNSDEKVSPETNPSIDLENTDPSTEIIQKNI